MGGKCPARKYHVEPLLHDVLSQGKHKEKSGTKPKIAGSV